MISDRALKLVQIRYNNIHYHIIIIRQYFNIKWCMVLTVFKFCILSSSGAVIARAFLILFEILIAVTI
jgi:hypothetical protein